MDLHHIVMIVHVENQILLCQQKCRLQVINSHNIIPYYTLRACKKVKDVTIDLSNYIKSSDLAVYALKTDIPSLNEYAKTSDLSVYAFKLDIPYSLDSYAPLSMVGNIEAKVDKLNIIDL